MIVAFMLVGFASARPAGKESYNGKEAAANEVLVKFKAATPEDIHNIKIKADVDEAEPVGSTGAMRLHSKSKNVETLISELSARGDVEYAEPNYIVYATLTPNDPNFVNGNLWGPGKISAPSAWDISTGSTAYVAAVIDTGIDYTHSDLSANVWSAPAEYTVNIAGTSIKCPAGSHGFNAITNTCDPMDDEGHGTHVSGTIGAVGNNNIGVTGVNWNTKIIGAKFLDSTGSGYTSNAVNAIDFVIQTKQLTGANVRVLSNSWGGGGYDQTLLDEINQANSNGMLFVAAAGNSGKNNNRFAFYPANYAASNVVAVAATDSTDTLASWSNYGSTTVDLAAPGVSILSTIPGPSYAYYSGTSMATPHVSGAALLILSECDLNTAQLKTNILDNVDPVSSLVGKTVTGGRLNVNKAIRACSAPATPTTTMLSVSPTSSIYGELVTFTATVLPDSATGTVTFYDGGTALGSGTLSSGMASYSTSSLSAGSHSITATYNGNSNFLTSTSNTVSQTVESAPASDFSLSASPTSRSVNPGSGTSYTVSITRSSGFAEAITLRVSGLPEDYALGTFKPPTTTGTSTKLSITTSSSTPAGTYPLTITGTSDSLSHTTTITLIVKSRSR